MTNLFGSKFRGILLKCNANNFSYIWTECNEIKKKVQGDEPQHSWDKLELQQ